MMFSWMKFFLMALAITNSAYAATITVTSDQDDGSPGTLRDAIQQASDGDTIQFASDVKLITLTQGQLQIDKDRLRIIGSGVILDGNQKTRIFAINEGISLRLEFLVLTHGNALNDAEGGGAINNHGILSLLGCVLTYNQAEDETCDGMGGALYNYGGDVSMTDCKLMNNIASGSAGAFFSFNGSASIEDCLFLDNNAYGDGGAIENRGGNQLYIECTTFADNYTSGRSDGGAILNNFATLTLRTCIFTGNSCLGSGGAIWNNRDSTLNVSDTLIMKNMAAPWAQGGAIYNSAGGELTITNSQIHWNHPDNVMNAPASAL
ncbi:MAG: right-handed parallel beta-helix repeat-containing protein [Parachlamydia sp.]|nr:right-handed parallel beta-helix repeat-containing protein [Parachlamydia sp.]